MVKLRGRTLISIAIRLRKTVLISRYDWYLILYRKGILFWKKKLVASSSYFPTYSIDKFNIYNQFYQKISNSDSFSISRTLFNIPDGFDLKVSMCREPDWKLRVDEGEGDSKQTLTHLLTHPHLHPQDSNEFPIVSYRTLVGFDKILSDSNIRDLLVGNVTRIPIKSDRILRDLRRIW
jgi:hypothetical protein